MSDSLPNLIIGCGYLGRRVAAAWLQAGRAVSALTRSTANAAELSRHGIRPVIGDICEPASLSDLPAAETVLFAVGYDRSAGRPQREVYVDGLRNVLERMASRCRRFIYISSSSVYGQSSGEWVDESSPCEPVQPGGQCCLAAEALIDEFFPTASQSDDSSAAASILRLSGIYGPERLLSRIEGLRAGEPLSGRGDAWLNLIHVDDAASAVLACEQRGRAGETYLATDDQPIRREEYYGELARRVGAPPPVFLDGEPAKRGSGGLNKRCSNRKVRTELGLTLTYPSINAGLPHALGLPGESVPRGEPPASRPHHPVG